MSSRGTKASLVGTQSPFGDRWGPYAVTNWAPRAEHGHQRAHSEHRSRVVAPHAEAFEALQKNGQLLGHTRRNGAQEFTQAFFEHLLVFQTALPQRNHVPTQAA